jgi:hypothetical protein
VLQIWLDQADGQVLSEGEEVTFMDWGNAFIMVSLAGSGCWWEHLIIFGDIARFRKYSRPFASCAMCQLLDNTHDLLHDITH